MKAEEKASAKVGKDISEAAVNASLSEGEKGWERYTPSGSFDIKIGQFIVYESDWRDGPMEWIIYKRTSSGYSWYRFKK